MLKKSMKIVSVLMAILLVVALTTPAFAANSDDLDWGSVTITSEESDLGNKVGNVMGNALYIMQVIGMGVAVIMLIVLAIKYISAAPGDKAEIKKHAVVYIVGAVVLFGASGILALIRNFATNNINA